MASTFNARTEVLQELVGRNRLIGKVQIDQIYALDQHENLAYTHAGGGPKYLSLALFGNHRRYLRFIAETTLTSGPEMGMIIAMEDCVRKLKRTAPVRHGYLRKSGKPIVYDNGAVIYERPPEQRRLSEAELNAIIKTEGD